jgi:hypothetical protein
MHASHVLQWCARGGRLQQSHSMQGLLIFLVVHTAIRQESHAVILDRYSLVNPGW